MINFYMINSFTKLRLALRLLSNLQVPDEAISSADQLIQSFLSKFYGEVSSFSISMP